MENWIQSILATAIVVLAGFATACAECSRSNNHCEGNVTVNCVGGDDDLPHWDRTDCGEQHCVEGTLGDRTRALCALEPSPRAACLELDNGDARACDGGQHLTCEFGYVTELKDCGDPALCEPWVSGCLARPGPDPTCQQMQQMNKVMFAYSDSYCDGSTMIECDGEFVVVAKDCGSVALCYTAGPGIINPIWQRTSTCIQSTTSDPRCTSTGFYRLCDGQTRVVCADQYLVEAVDCTAMGLGCDHWGYCSNQT